MRVRCIFYIFKAKYLENKKWSGTDTKTWSCGFPGNLKWSDSPGAFAAGGQQAWDWRAVCSGFSPSLLQRTQRSPKAFAFEMRLVPSDWHYVIVVTAATQGLLMTLPGLLCLTRGEAWPALLHLILSSFKHADKMKELQGAQPTPSTSLFQSTPCPSCFNYITAICPSFHPPLKLSSFFFFWCISK